jgi:hypothetical protein
MFGLSSSAARNDVPVTSHDTGIAITFFAVLAALTLTLIGGTRILVPIGCSLDPGLAPPHVDSQVTAFSRRGAPCLVSPHNGDGRVKSLEVVAAPRNGRISMRGATGLFYVPNSQFRGTDTFTFRVVRRTDTNEVATSLVNMQVNVD